MKTVKRSKIFKKHYKARIATHNKLIIQFDARVKAFMSGERGQSLDDHGLIGPKLGQRAFSVTGDIRVV